MVLVMQWSSLVVPALVTPVVLYVALVVQRRSGPAAGGLVATFPFQSAISVVGVAAASGTTAVAAFGTAAAVNLLPQVMYAVAFALGMSSGGIPRAVAASAVVYPLAVLAARAAPMALAEVAGLAALVAGAAFLKSRHLVPVHDATASSTSARVLVPLGTAAGARGRDVG